MAKRATASALLQAGRRKPPAVSPPEQPVIPAGPPAVDVAAGQRDDWSVKDFVAPPSELNDQSTELRVDSATSQLSDSITIRSEYESPSSLDPSSMRAADPVIPLGDHRDTSQLDDLMTEQPADLSKDMASAPNISTSPLHDQSPSELVTPLFRTTGVDLTTTSLVADEPLSSPVNKSTGGLIAQMTSPQVDVLLSAPIVEPTSPLVNQSTSTPVDLLTRVPDAGGATSGVRQGCETSELDHETSALGEVAGVPDTEGGPRGNGAAASPVPVASPGPQVASAHGRAAKKRDAAPNVHASATAPQTAVGAATSSLVTEATGRYERLTVFLTPAQRQWLKRTGRQMPVEGLSVSDIVRLAVNRLSADVNAGLPLVDELTSQAYGEAETMAGRRNRGLPPV